MQRSNTECCLISFAQLLHCMLHPGFLSAACVNAIVFVRWQEQQQREHEDDMRARLRRSESIEKAAVSDCWIGLVIFILIGVV